MAYIKSVTLEHHNIPFGIGEASPRLSWTFENEQQDWVQTSYEIEIKRADLGTRGYRVFTSDSVLVPWPADALKSREVANIRVRATGRTQPPTEEQTSWSEYITVEAGLLERQDWTSEFVAAPKTEAANSAITPALLRKIFKISKQVRKARLYITAQGVYEAQINGHQVGDQILAPGWTSYNYHLNYQTFDVKELLSTGDQLLNVELGEGWFCTRLGFGGGKRCIYGDRPAILAQLEIAFVDGEILTVGSDETWKTSTGPIISSEIYDGEIYDASLVKKGWDSVSFDDKTWNSVEVVDFPASKILSPKGPPVRRIETLKIKDVIRSPTGKTILDFGQNLVGYLQVRVTGTSGTEIEFQHVEVLSHQGECATRPLRDCKAKDTLRLSGESIVWEPKFTFHGFRYVQIVGWPEGEPLDIKAVVLHTDMEETGSFKCSNSDINQLHQNIKWGMRGNFLSIPTDCPQRDERLGWTGDIQIFSPTASFLYNTAGMLSGWLQDLAVEQIQDNDGVPPLVCPNIIEASFPKAQAAWADAVILTPYDLYTAFGDVKILSDQHESMKVWIDKALPREASGLWNPTVHQLGDWLDPDAPPDDPAKGKTDPHLVANAYLARITQTMAKISKILGFHDDYDHYTKEAERITAAFRDEYVTKSGRLAPDTMTSLSLALSLNLLGDSKASEAAAKRLVTLVRSSAFKIGTGFVGTPLILPVLATAGYPQVAYRMLLEKKCPSWLYPITMGATTMWERWDSMLPNGKINPGSMTSFNHYALGSVGAFLHGTLGGISPKEPGWKVVRVEPVPGGRVTWAKVAFRGPYGQVRCEWEVKDGKFTIEILIPPNSKAEVKLPGQQDIKSAGSGRHRWSLDYEEGDWPTALRDPFSPPPDEGDPV
ncbi:putative rhamnosidase [Bisporella sp. PMI_857]|nr:putative rhamnosidase [Bisporella sp. PMI_857]